MNDKQLKKLKALQNKLFEAMVFDTNPENWVGFGKKVAEMDKQEKDEATWCRRQATSSIALWEKIDKLIAAHSEPTQHSLFDTASVDIKAIEEEADQLLVTLQEKEGAVH